MKHQGEGDFMLLCDQVSISTRKASLYMQGSTTWTELSYQGKVLCNDLESLVNIENPVHVKLCDTCGMPGCNHNGNVNISRIGEYILWSPPIGEDIPEIDYESKFALIAYWGSLLFSVDIWKEVVGVDPEAYPDATRLHLFLSWLSEYDLDESVHEQGDLVPSFHWRLVYKSDFDRAPVLRHLEQLVAWFEAAPNQPLGGKLVQARDISAQIEVLELVMPDHRWPAYANISGRIHPAFENGWIFLRES
jgi:hypothetical protein